MKKELNPVVAVLVIAIAVAVVLYCYFVVFNGKQVVHPGLPASVKMHAPTPGLKPEHRHISGEAPPPSEASKPATTGASKPTAP